MCVVCVQAVPKHGWWKRSLSYLTEHHLRVAQAILGTAYDSDFLTVSAAGDAVEYGPIDEKVYAGLHAVMCSVFADMAIFERGPSGRARRAVLDVPTKHTFVENELSVPRYVVSALARKAVSKRTAMSLWAIERHRIASQTRQCFVLLEAETVEGRLLWMHFDNEAPRWVPRTVVEAASAGLAAVEQFDGMMLHDFGYSRLAPSDTGIVLPASVSAKRMCSFCHRERMAVAFTLARPSCCQVCSDAGVKEVRPVRPSVLSREGVSTLEKRMPLIDLSSDAPLLAFLHAHLSRNGSSTHKHAFYDRDTDILKRAVMLIRGDRKGAFAPREGSSKRLTSGSACLSVSDKRRDIVSLFGKQPEEFGVTGDEAEAVRKMYEELMSASEQQSQPSSQPQVRSAGEEACRAAGLCIAFQGWKGSRCRKGVRCSRKHEMLEGTLPPAKRPRGLPRPQKQQADPSEVQSPSTCDGAEGTDVFEGLIQGADAEKPARATMDDDKVQRLAGEEGLTLIPSRIASGYLCVYKNKKSFEAVVVRDGKRHHLGNFGTEARAALAVARHLGPEQSAVAAAREGGDPAVANVLQPPFPQPPSVQPPSLQPPSLRPPSVQPPSLQPSSLQPPPVLPPAGAPSLFVDLTDMRPSATAAAAASATAAAAALPRLPTAAQPILTPEAEVPSIFDGFAVSSERVWMDTSDHESDNESEHGSLFSDPDESDSDDDDPEWVDEDMEVSLDAAVAIVGGGTGRKRGREEPHQVPAAATSSGEEEGEATGSPSASARDAGSEVARNAVQTAAAAPVAGAPAGTDNTVAARKQARLANRAINATASLARTPGGSRSFDSKHVELPWVKKSLKVVLQDIADHEAKHVGAGARLRTQERVMEARKRASNRLGADNANRAIPLDDTLQSEGWMCFDKRYPADMTMMAKTAHGEVLAPRYSDVFIMLRSHFKRLARNAGYEWSRFSGKNNQEVQRRRRLLAHARSCPRVQTGDTSLTARETCVEWDPELRMCWRDEAGLHEREGSLLPETRCAACSLEHLWSLHDGDRLGVDGPAIRGLKTEYSKFSWEKGAKMFPSDPSECFTDLPISWTQLSGRYLEWAKQINRRRRALDAGLPWLDVKLLRTHSDRHGAVLNLKRLGVGADKGAPFLCMSRELWDTVYGLEDGVVSGEELTPAVVGSSTSSVGYLVRRLHAEKDVVVSEAVATVLFGCLGVSSAGAFAVLQWTAVLEKATLLAASGACSIHALRALHELAQASCGSSVHGRPLLTAAGSNQADEPGEDEGLMDLGWRGSGSCADSASDVCAAHMIP